MNTPTLDVERFRKIWALVEHGATEGERAAARARAEAIASAAGLTLQQAVEGITPASPARTFASFFEEFFNSPEQLAKQAERARRDEIQRKQILKWYGSEDAVFARTDQELALEAAIADIATWDFWTDNDGVEHRFARALDGIEPMFWSHDELTPRTREIIKAAYPWPAGLNGLLDELRSWNLLRRDREIVGRGEWNHYAEVECRISLLEWALDVGQPAHCWDDVQARLDWKRYEYERQWLDPTERDDPFLDRLEADLQILRKNATAPKSSGYRARGGARKTARSDQNQLNLFPQT